MSCCKSDETQTETENCCSKQNSPEGHTEQKPWEIEQKSGAFHMDLSVPGMHCAGCISRIEKAVLGLDGVEKARVNLSTKRVSVDWDRNRQDSDTIINTIQNLGFDVQPQTPDTKQNIELDKAGGELLRAMAVAGFASANIMLLSVSIWSGASHATALMFHWISALIALPTVFYSGQPFYRSAWKSLRQGQLNMDVPISLAVILAAGMSLYETLTNGHMAWFDASVMLLFFLLIGRYLDHMMRERARSSVAQLLTLSAPGATTVSATGERQYKKISDLKIGMTIAVAAGERIPADGDIVKGVSEIDSSLITGETTPEPTTQGMRVYAGAMNLTGPLEISIKSVGADTFLSEMIRLMEIAEQGKAKYVRLANRVAQLYAPVVHILAAVTFFGWLFYTGGDWHTSLMYAVAVLIITCPCALGLAVPVVQIVAGGVLFKNGIMVKDGAALEKLSQIDSVCFDKTGTLTLGRPTFIQQTDLDLNALSIAAGLAHQSKHPLSKALTLVAENSETPYAELMEVKEYPGSGLEGQWNGSIVRLGNRSWCGMEDDAGNISAPSYLELCLKIGDEEAILYQFEDEIRSDAIETIAALQKQNLKLDIISGDREQAVRTVAQRLNITSYHARLKPQDKVTHIETLANEGRKVLMVGDGINDAPALASGFVSMAPSTASDVGRTAADFVFLGEKLGAIAYTLKISKQATSLVKQNFALAAIYNVIAVPIAITGNATPLIAAIAMSSSSLIVTLNALRLRLTKSESAPISGNMDKKPDQYIRSPLPQPKVTS